WTPPPQTRLRKTLERPKQCSSLRRQRRTEVIMALPHHGEVERCVVRLLENDPAGILPLSRLHEQVEAQLRERAPSRASLQRMLEVRSELFLVLLQRREVPGLNRWTPALRESYAAALAENGLGDEPHIALRRDVDSAPPASSQT